MLPQLCPIPNWRFLHTGELWAAPIQLPPRGLGPATPKWYRRLASRHRTQRAAADTKPPIKTATHYTSKSGARVHVVIGPGIGPLEVERPVTGAHDWTRQWDFVLSAL